jgi:hypothetical protein
MIALDMVKKQVLESVREAYTFEQEEQQKKWRSLAEDEARQEAERKK